MRIDKHPTCSYCQQIEGEYKILLEFTSIQAAKSAARNLLAFLGEDLAPAAPAEPPPHKTCEEVTEENDPLTEIQESKAAFSDMLRVYRANHSYSQRRFAELLGTTQSNICHWENGSVIPSLGTQAAIRKKIESGEFNV